MLIADLKVALYGFSTEQQAEASVSATFPDLEDLNVGATLAKIEVSMGFVQGGLAVGSSGQLSVRESILRWVLEKVEGMTRGVFYERLLGTSYAGMIVPEMDFEEMMENERERDKDYEIAPE